MIRHLRHFAREVRDISVETFDIASKGALAHLRKAIAEARPLRTNFAALAIESSLRAV